MTVGIGMGTGLACSTGSTRTAWDTLAVVPAVAAVFAAVAVEALVHEPAVGVGWVEGMVVPLESKQARNAPQLPDILRPLDTPLGHSNPKIERFVNIEKKHLGNPIP